MATLPLRQIEGKYEILEKIKEGGMGAIYKVRHRLLDEIRVVKIMRPQIADSDELQQRFAREARAAIRLKHPNIAQLYDFAVESDGVAYMVMEFIDGVTLQEMLARNGPAPLDLTLEMARQGLEALRYLHAHGYVHRDVAPDNLMLTKDFAGQPHVKLIDLGIVKHLAGGGEGLTATGTFLGKVRYSSPEQFSGEKGGVDQRSDLYSFGVMLYELLTGRCPIMGENLSQLVAAHLFQPPLSFEETDPGGRVPEEVRATVMRSLAKTPDERIASAQEFQDLVVRQQRTRNLSQDLETTLSTTLQLRTQGDRTQPGTTQGRLDEQFGLVKTPGPSAGLRAADAVSAGTAGEQLARLLTTAQQLAQERHWEQARLLLYQALAIDPDHGEIRELLTGVETSLEQAVEEETRSQAIAQAVARVEACLGEERLDDATREIERARAEYGDATELSGLESRIAELRGALAERARQCEIGEAVARIGLLLDAEQTEPAATALAAAERRFGKEEEPLGALRLRLTDATQRLEERRREQAAAARRERARALLGEASELAGRRAFAEAIVRAEKALALDPGAAEAQLALEGYRADEANRLEEIRRQRALDQAATRIEQLLQREQTDAAGRELEAAAASLGADDRLEQLRSGLEVLRRELEDRDRERARLQAIAAAVSAVESLLARESADDAQSALEDAAARLGDDARWRALAERIARLRADLVERQRRRVLEAQRRQEEERRQQEEERLRVESDARREEEERSRREAVEARRRRAQALLQEAEEQAGRGELALALETSRAALDLDPERARAAAEQYERALEAEARTERLEQLLATARSEIVAGQLEEALKSLGAGRHEHGGDPGWRRLFSETEAEIARREAERRRLEAVAAEAAVVDRLIAKGRLKRAEQRLEKARVDLGEADSWAELGGRLDSLRLEAQRRARSTAENRQGRGIKPLYWAAAVGAALVAGLGAWSVWSWRSGSTATRPVAEISRAEVATEIGTELESRRQADPSSSDGSSVAMPVVPPLEKALETKGVSTSAPLDAPVERAPDAEPPRRSEESAPPPGNGAVKAAKSMPAAGVGADRAKRVPPAAGERSRAAAEPIPVPVERLRVNPLPTAPAPEPSPPPPEPTTAPAPRSGTDARVVVPVVPAAGVESPARAAAPPPEPFDQTVERRRVMEVLALYSGAIEAFDSEGLRRVWPGISSDALATFQKAFDGARTIDVSITGCRIEVEPSRASATCAVRQTYRPKRGTNQNLRASETFRLTRESQRWVIESRTTN